MQFFSSEGAVCDFPFPDIERNVEGGEEAQSIKTMQKADFQIYIFFLKKF